MSVMGQKLTNLFSAIVSGTDPFRTSNRLRIFEISSLIQ
jgi:hypothetical protein